jgi:hypothetical protein
MAILNVNNDEIIKLTAKLEKLHRSAFPSAVRNTLNNAAFETKKNIPVVARSKFTTRQKTFFKRFSTVSKASGFDLSKMISIAGIDASKDPEMASNLESQEYGGMVRAKKLIPHDDSRISKSQSKRVSAKNRLNKVRAHNGTKAFKSHKGTRKSRFVAAVMSTAKSGKSHMLLKTGAKGTIYEVKGIKSSKKTRKVSFKIKKLYSVRDTNRHNVKSRGFVRQSANLASKKLEDFYVSNAEYQFKKALKK